MSLRITGWTIDGFGVFSDYTSPPLGDGLTVFLGANEAGKSTLLAFIRGTLFGFKDRRSAGALYTPLGGGRHGGRLFLAAADGLYTVDRDAGRRAKPLVTLPGGGQGGAAELQLLLGNADETLFESIFAFSLGELQELATLTKDDIADRIFGASLMGAGRSPQHVLSDLESAATPLFKQRGHNTVVADLLREHDDIAARLRAARLEASGLAELERGLDVAEAEVETRRAAAEEQRVQHAHAAALIRLWPEALELHEAELALEALPADDRCDGTQAAELADLEAEAQLQRERCVSLARLDSEVARARDAHDAALSQLGAGWSAERLETLDTALPARDEVRDWSGRLQSAAAEAAATTAAADALSRDLADWTIRHERARAELPDEPPSVADLTANLRALSELRGLLTDLRQNGSAPARRSRSLVAASLVVAAILLGLAVWLLSRGDTAPALALFAATLATAVLGITNARHTQPPVGDQSALRRRADALASTLGMPAQFGAVHLEMRDNDLRRLEDDRRAYDAGVSHLAHLAADGDELERRAHAATARDSAATDRQARLAGEWQAWCSHHGVPVGLTPDGVVDFFALVAQARQAAAALSAAHTERERISASLAAWQRRAQTLLGVELGGEALVARLTAAARTQTARAALETTIARCMHTAEAHFTDAATARAVLFDLATADVDELRRRAAALLDDLRAAESSRDRAIETRQVLRSRLEVLQQSADVPALDAQREEVVARLDAALAEWRTLRLATGLMEHTIGQFVTEHQPSVLSHASRLFARVSGGRYTNVLQEGLSREFAVVDSEGRRRRPAELSRGTAEQLYLCIRLSFASEFAARAVALPLVMDDVLVNFDPARARAMASILADTAAERQLLYFTCHPATRDALVEAGGDRVTVIDLDERTLAGSSA